jgi:hypothetical protein
MLYDASDDWLTSPMLISECHLKQTLSFATRHETLPAPQVTPQATNKALWHERLHLSSRHRDVNIQEKLI